MILLIVSMITKQQIGYGDGMIILIMGLYIDIDLKLRTLKCAYAP